MLPVENRTVSGKITWTERREKNKAQKQEWPRPQTYLVRKATHTVPCWENEKF